jgi:8-amino-7-oxononanoate synthase
VPEGRARLRVTLSALHGVADVDGLVEAMAKSRERIRLGLVETARREAVLAR